MRFCLAFSPFLLCLDVEWIHTWLQSDSRSVRIRFHVVFHRFECVFQSLLFFGSDDTRMNAWLKVASERVCLVIHIARCLVVSVCSCFSLFGPELCDVTVDVPVCGPLIGYHLRSSASLK